MISSDSEVTISSESNDHDFPESVDIWLAKIKKQSEETMKLREDGKKTTVLTLQNVNKSTSERLWEMKIKDKFIDSLIVCQDGFKEPLHLDVLSNLKTAIFNYLVVIPNVRNDMCKEFLLDSSITSDLFQLIVYFAYHKKCNLSKENAFDLGIISTKFGMTPLTDYCINYILNNCDSDMAVKGLYLTSLQTTPNVYDIAKKVFNDYIQNRFEQIYTDGHHSFYKLSYGLMLEILKSNKLNITSEVFIWKVIELWVRFDVDQRLNLLIPLMIETLRFGRLKKSFIVDSIFNSDLFQRQSSEAKKECTRLIDKLFQGINQVAKDGYGLLYSKSSIYHRPRFTRELLLAFGGWIEGKTTQTIEIYDYQINLWQTSMVKLPKNMSYFALEILDDTIYVFGGSDSRQIFKNLRALKLDEDNPTWIEKCSMIEFRCYLTSAVCGGQLYAIGGFNRTTRIRKCERYDPKTNRWTEIADLNYPRSDASATVMKDRIYVAGGINDTCIEKTVEVYCSIENRWILVKSMLSPRTSFAFVAFMNQLWALGGNTGEERTKAVECYDPVSDTWTPGINMIDRRSTFKAISFNNELYVVGGYNGEAPISGVEKYVIDHGWVRVKQLKHDRSGLNLMSLKNKYDFFKI